MSYPGGKAGAGVYQAIINQMPPHEIYIEPFLGAGAVLRRKLPAAVNIGIDIDSRIAGYGDAAALDAAPFAALRKIATLVNADGIDWLAAREHWTGRELVYCDPPYLLSTRRSRRRQYLFELSDADHRRLLAVLKRLPCMVMVSSYSSPLYAVELADWRLVTFQATTRGRPALEHLWCNFPAPAALHDYRFLGAGFRERERIARKARRWQAKLGRLAPLERQAVLSACLGAPSSTIAVSDE